MYTEYIYHALKYLCAAFLGIEMIKLDIIALIQNPLYTKDK